MTVKVDASTVFPELIAKADELLTVMRALVESNLALVNALSSAVEDESPTPEPSTTTGLLD